jgi:hypothetical protein
VSNFRKPRRGSCPRPWALFAAVAALLLPSGVRAQQVLHESLVRPSETQPIVLRADDITTWQEGTQRVFLLKGKATIAQGDTLVRMPQGVVWVDEQRLNSTGVNYLDVYGEGRIQLQHGSEVEADYGYVHLATSGAVKIKAYGGPVAQTELPQDPIFQRGKANRPASPPAPAASAAAAPAAPSTVQTALLAQPPNAPSQVVPASAIPVPSGQDNTAASPQAIPTQLPRTAPSTGATDAVVPPTIPSGPRGLKSPAAPEAEPPKDSTPRPFPLGPTPVEGEPKSLSIRPRSGQDGLNYQKFVMPNGETAIVFTSGVILRVSTPRAGKAPPPPPVDKKDKKGTKKADVPPSRPPPGPSFVLDIEADRLVFWTKGGDGQELVDNMRSSEGQTSRSLEFFLSGNCEIRMKTEQGLEQNLRAEQVYYDVNRLVAVALKGDMEMKQQTMPYPIHLQADELLQLNAKQFQANSAIVYSTILPSDPGLLIHLSEIKIEEIDTPKRGFLGFPVKDPVTGAPVIDKGHYFRGTNAVTWLEGLPVFYFPYLSGRVEDPLGPLENFNFNVNRIFGTQLFTTWDTYQLLGLQPLPGTRWRTYADYMTARGPALGQEFDYATGEIFGIPVKVDSILKMYGIHDMGQDVLGGSLGQFLPVNPQTLPGIPYVHPQYRGRLKEQLSIQDLPYGFSFKSQIALISDRNFLQQYYFNEYLTDLNQDTYAYLKQQQNNWAWSALGDVRWDQSWVTRTNWLPRLDGWLLNESLLDRLTWNVHGSVGYAQLKTADTPPPVFPTDKSVDLGRLDLMQDLSLPFYLGPFKVVPYVQADFAYYSQSLQGNSNLPPDAGASYYGPGGTLLSGLGGPLYNSQLMPGGGEGRAYGAGGLRTSLPLSRLFPEIKSDLFNLDGIYHKATLSGNYYYGRSSTSMFNLPQLDRLNDDATDRTLRDIYAYQPSLNPTNAMFLTTSPIFNPQIFALQRLVAQQTMNYTDTLGNIDVLQLGLRQRWQTKRGFPGNEHVVDWMTLDLQGSIFPEYQQVALTNPIGILQYDWVWNVGDRTALTSSGWTEPVNSGLAPRYFNVGSLINRPDGTNVYLGYRQIDPLLSRAVIASIAYPFSAKYSLTASTAWDFGAKNQTYMFLLTRMGTDVMVTAGLSYNSILNNFGFTFEVIPSLLRNQFKQGQGIGVANSGQGPMGNPSSGR